MIRKNTLALSALTLLATAGVAAAHGGHADGGFAHGVAHPVSGLDHLLAMLGVGLWAAQLDGRARYVVPLAFVACMALGGALQFGGVNVPLVEAGILTSVLAVGLLVAAGLRLPTWAAATAVGAFALFHGAAHAAEAAGASAVVYSAGFVLATAALHAAGVALGLAAGKAHAPVLARLAGGAVAACAVLLITSVL